LSTLFTWTPYQHLCLYTEVNNTKYLLLLGFGIVTTFPYAIARKVSGISSLGMRCCSVLPINFVCVVLLCTVTFLKLQMAAEKVYILSHVNKLLIMHFIRHLVLLLSLYTCLLNLLNQRAINHRS